MNGTPVAPQITEYLYRRATAAGLPISGTFELTPVCNMDCKMCYVRMSRQQQEAIGPLATAEQWLALGQEAAKAGMLYLLVTGGEPFLHPQIRQILEGLNRLGLILSINTNGTMIDQEVMAWLKKCPPMRVNISLYGSSDETYHRLCGNPRGFTQVTQAIDLLTAAGIQVKINCSLTPYNGAELPRMVAFANERNLPIQAAAYMFPPTRKDPEALGKNHRFTPEEAAYYTAYGEYLTLGRERFLQQEGALQRVSDPEDMCMDLGDGIRCRAGRCSFWITWQGQMLPCGMFPPGDSPNIFEVPFLSAWDKTKDYASGIRLPAACAGCAAKDQCRACAAMVITESGRFDRIPQYRCDMTRAYPDQWNRVKEEIL